MRKVQCQLTHCVMTPPRKTPAEPPAAAEAPQKPSALPISFGSGKRPITRDSAAGAIATVMVLMSEGQGSLAALPILAAIAVTFTATYFILLAGEYIKGALKYSGLSLLQRVMGLVLAAVAVQFLAEGGAGASGIAQPVRADPQRR
jgi:small neutral amino acid transporter SnatA (MarC family)